MAGGAERAGGAPSKADHRDFRGSSAGAWVGSPGLPVDRRPEARSTAAGTRRQTTQPASTRVRGGARHDNGQDVDSTARRLPRWLTASSCLLTGFGEDSSLPEGLRPRRHGEEVVSFLCCLNSTMRRAFIRGGGAVSKWWPLSSTTGLSPG